MNEPVRALKRFGQNFLKNRYIAEKIVEAIEPTPQDTILEIGAGKGALTQLLVGKDIRQLIAVEIDSRLIDELKLFEKSGSKFRLINHDFMDLSIQDMAGGSRLKLIGNIPYNLTSNIIFKVLDNYKYISKAVLMIQKEVADRIVAPPGGRDYGILSVMVGIHGMVEKIMVVNRENFYPVPGVDSAVIAIDLFDKIENIEDYKLFKDLVKASFQTRRKKLQNNLKRFIGADVTALIKSVDLDKRPEQLSVSDFRSLANEVYYLKSESIK